VTRVFLGFASLFGSLALDFSILLALGSERTVLLVSDWQYSVAIGAEPCHPDSLVRPTLGWLAVGAIAVFAAMSVFFFRSCEVGTVSNPSSPEGGPNRPSHPLHNLDDSATVTYW
jgi:hypothetical protein